MKEFKKTYVPYQIKIVAQEGITKEEIESAIASHFGIHSPAVAAKYGIEPDVIVEESVSYITSHGGNGPVIMIKRKYD